ncbi:threonine/serine dehydratase [Chitinasiproducens palmae]|uniref:Threonine dehydratase n=1 Tax=Chitinasiproducens palmae TaxID=1770053 RepID=A0A1H2PVC4_9BURK|nr:threonine/serine dehydratase [Chitinasiproducens palmae]SDV51247.1 threonine dehydratase [Chitinasiproducens palmae]
MTDTLAATDAAISAAINADTIRETAQALRGRIVDTPVAPLSGRHVEKLLGPDADVWMKLELFQKTGTFKARGALNVARHFTDEERARGVTAVSAGNHAVAAAFAAREIGASAKIVVQASANPQRLAAARSYGAELILQPDGQSAFAEMERLIAEEGRTMIHPFEGPRTSLGTATLGLEFVEQVADLDAVIVAIGGGGLASGVAAATKIFRPTCEVFGVEPEDADVMRRSFDAGEPVRMPRPSTTIADSLAPPMTLPMSYALCRRYLDGLVTVSDDEIRRALAVLFQDGKLAVEPAAAAALAALLGPLRERLAGRRVGVIVCGANIDRVTFGTLLERGTALLD